MSRPGHTISSMLRPAIIGALIGGVFVTAGCTRRDAPYRFRAPLVSSVRADEVPAPHVAADASVTTDTMTDRHGVQVRPARLNVDSLAGRLRSFVGKRDSMASDTEFAVSALAAIGVTVDAKLEAVRDGAGLMQLAQERRAVAGSGATPLVGDLVVFDDVEKNTANSLVGIVVAVRDDHTVEFLYLWRRVVRRGFLNRDKPRTTRDKSGRVLNTFVRHFDTRGKKGLAGELFSSHVRLEHLAQAGFVR